MIVSRIIRLGIQNTRQLFTCPSKFHTGNIQSRLVSQNLQVIRCFAETSQSASVCWKCESSGEMKNRIICDKCGVLVTPDMTKNYFNLLDIPEKFDMDNQKLTEKFRQFQSIVHPDKFSNKSDIEQRHAMDWSSLLNKAYSILSTPLKRAEYMLQLKNITISEKNETINPEFLMEMMERNEEIAELETRSQCDEQLQKLKVELENLYKEFSEIFEANNLDKAREMLIRIRYVNNLEKKIKEKLYELHD
uniref:CSON006038 protein n=1 Tax=Culicoides sonorensis TaxID=179676 RepID=A0A336LWJ3_CULSO